MFKDLDHSRKREVKSALATWAVKTGLVMVEKYLMFSALSSKESVLLIMNMLVEGMVDRACAVLSVEGAPDTLNTRRVLDVFSRRLLGEVQLQFQTPGSEKEQAERLAQHWKKLQAAKRAFTDAERKARKQERGNDSVPRSVARPFYFLRGDQVQLGNVLARGAYGTVHVVRRIEHQHFPSNRKYAAKALNSLNKKSARRQLAMEATNIGVTHPAFIMPLGMTLTEPHVIIMDMWPQKNLGRYCWRKLPGSRQLEAPWAAKNDVEALCLFERCVKSLVIGLAEALWALHSENFSHNDLHEGNVLVSVREVEGRTEWRLGICDWGRASSLAEERRLAIENKGGRDYIPPEHLGPPPPSSHPKGGILAPPTDVYAFGYLLKLILKNRERKVPTEWLVVAQECQERDREKRPTMEKVLGQLKSSMDKEQ